MIDEFHTAGYLAHNRARQEHLASLGLDLENKTVLELGAGVGDHTGFWLKRNSEVTCVEARQENVLRIREAHPGVKVLKCDLEKDELPPRMSYDVVYAYGILYHLGRPGEALRQWARACRSLLLLETCVDPNREMSVGFISEVTQNPTASFTGKACRPGRLWVFSTLQDHFPHVYMPLTQPHHEEFPLDWSDVRTYGLSRAVFVASRRPLENAVLTEGVPTAQFRR